MKLIVILLAISCMKLSSAESFMPSIEWQKASLKRDITHKIERRLDTVIENKRYFLDVKILASMPPMPDFSIPTEQPPEGIRFSNRTPDQSSGDYIVFSKFGLEIPTVSAMEPAPAPKKSDYEFKWKYNRSLDIFQNIEEIEIAVSLNQDYPEEFRVMLQAIIESVDLGVLDIEPIYTFNYINLSPLSEKSEEVIAKADEATPVETKPDLIELISKFSNAIALILATLLLGIISFILLKKYEKIKKDDRMSLQGALNSEEKREDEKKDKNDELAAGAGGSNNGKDEGHHIDGFERFTNYLESNPNEAIMIIRKWIKANRVECKKALYGLVKSLDTKSLSNIFDKIPSQFREDWKSIINEKEAYISDLNEIEAFVSNEIIQDIIVPSAIQDDDLLEIIVNMTDSNSAQFISDNPEMGAYYLQLLNTKQIGQIFNLLDQPQITKALKFMTKTSGEDIALHAQELKEAITPYSNIEVEDSAIKKIAELLPLSAISKDQPLYDSLRDAKAFGAVARLAKDHFPSFLIKNLSEQLTESLLSSYPIKKKAELFYILDEQTREHFYECLGEAGDTAKEMIQIELDNFESNEVASKDLEKRSTLIWEEFVGHSRKKISITYESNTELQEVIRNWMSKKNTQLNIVEDDLAA